MGAAPQLRAKDWTGGLEAGAGAASARRSDGRSGHGRACREGTV